MPDDRRRAEAATLDALHRKVTGREPAMWGPSIVGYGSYRYRYDSGHEGVMARAGFSPRKAASVVYLTGTYGGARQADADALFARLGPHSVGKACLYLKQLSDINLAVLEQLVKNSVAEIKRRYPKTK